MAGLRFPNTNITFVEYPEDDPSEWQGSGIDMMWIDEPCSITAQDVEKIHCKWAGKILHWTPRRPE